MKHRVAFLLAAILTAVPHVARAQGTLAPVVLQTLPAVNVPMGGGTTNVSMAGKFGVDGVRGPITRFDLIMGVMDMELFPEVAPATVANLRKYIAAGHYENTFIHRAVPNFVIQGGGYKVASDVPHIPQFATVKNEFQRSNVKGTVAMAKLSGDIHSATSEWYVNLKDNWPLDVPGEQFTVFGRMIGKSTERATTITALPNVNLGSPLDELPLYNYTADAPILVNNLVKLNSLREIPLIPATGTTGGYLVLSATSSNPNLLTAVVNGPVLTLKSAATGTGKAVVTVKAADVYGQFAQTSFTATVVNPALPVASVSVLDIGAAEPGSNTAAFRVSRTGSTAALMDIALSLAGSTAASGIDFTAIPNPVRIPAGAAYRDILVTAIDDTLKEGIEKIALAVAPGAAYTLPANNGITLIIADNDVPTVTISIPDAAATEGNPADTARVRFTRTGATTAPLSIPFTLSGVATAASDYNAPGSPAVIPAGASFVDITFATLDDGAAEGLEAIEVKATPRTVYNLPKADAVVHVFDNDVPTVSQSVMDATASEPGTDTARVRFTRTGPVTAPLTVYFKTAGTAVRGIDYVAPPLALTIPAGQTFTSFALTPREDVLVEPQETVLVSLEPSVFLNATPGSTTLFINDND